MTTRLGRHFIQIPGPTNVPDRVLRAIAAPTIDHRGPEFSAIMQDVLPGLQRLFKSAGPVVIFAGSGSGAWEAALVNTLSPGDKVLMAETGHFSNLWERMARKFALDVEYLPGDWRGGVNPARVEARLAEDKAHAIKAVAIVHNETSTGVTSDVAAIRRALDQTRHPALFLVDAISSLGSIDLRTAEWGIDVVVGGSQKGLMLPPGLGFNAVSEKALAAAKKAKLSRSFWDWEPILEANKAWSFPFTPNINLIFGLKEAVAMFEEVGLAAVFARHARHGEAVRRAVRAWDLELQAANPAEYSASVTAIRVPEGVNADSTRAVILEDFDMSLGAGLGKLAGKVFRIGHLGALNDLMIAGTLAGVEMGLLRAQVPHQRGGVLTALDFLARDSGRTAKKAAE
ncbi:MAG: aminotransferase class V-fold PLP-dependent enzyme [Alphaproteobacteria bacterium]|nr:aminotransferase class V-fold PLP-dependent enzyme [Alphaproteobacteria bacterium]